MKYIKSYQIFEWLKLDELDDLFLNLRDNNFFVDLYLNQGFIMITKMSTIILFKYSDIDNDVEMITNYLEQDGYKCNVNIKCYGEDDKTLYPSKLDSEFKCIQCITILFDKLKVNT